MSKIATCTYIYWYVHIRMYLIFYCNYVGGSRSVPDYDYWDDKKEGTFIYNLTIIIIIDQVHARAKQCFKS